MEGAAMKEWLTAREIAAEALPEMPTTHSAVVRLADRLGWADSLSYVRPRAGRGGGLEYHVNLLLPEARLEYERRHRQIERAEPAPAPALVLGDNLTDRAARERDARLAIVAAYEAFSKGQRLSEASRTQIFVDRYNLRSIAIDSWIVELVPQLSKRTLARWRSFKFMGRADRLAVDRAAARKGKGLLDTAEGGRLQTFVLALIAHQPLLTAKQVQVQCRAKFGDTLTNVETGQVFSVPPVRTFQHFIKTLKSTKVVLLTKLSDPDRYRSAMAPSGVGTYRWVGEPNTLWMIDASPIDALDRDGRRPNVYACIDIGTRRAIFYVSHTPRAAAVALLLRKAILAWGVPDKIKTDNGSDFVAAETKRLFASLQVEMELSQAYHPEEKIHVERVIKTFQHDCAAQLPGFIGHNVADRKRIEDRKTFAQRLHMETADAFGATLDEQDFQRLIDGWSETIYQQRPHAGLKGRTPASAAASSSKPIRTVDARALDILLMPIPDQGGIRTVTKLGIRVAGRHYIINAALPKDRVLVRMDPMDAGRAYAFDAETGAYVGEATCPELSGISAATLLAAKREITAERLNKSGREVRKEIKDLISGPSLLERALQVAARDLPNVIPLPKRQIPHETPAIAAALEAATRTPEPAPFSAQVERMHAELMAAAVPTMPAATDTVRPIRTQETPQQRYRRARALMARREGGEPISEADAYWLGNYTAGPEYRGQHAVYGEV
jgi:transposase InsO family protein